MIYRPDIAVPEPVALSAQAVELVIFDCDGVLVDVETHIVRIFADLGAELGWPISKQEIVERFIGRSETPMMEQVGERLGPDAALRWRELYRERLWQIVDAGGLAPVDGIKEALDALTIPSCVASSGNHDKMRRTLGATGLYGRFEGVIYSATEVARGKPAPDLFLYAAARRGTDPARCVVVEDSLYGVQAARAAGMRCFAYAAGLIPPERLAGPQTVVFDDMRSLPGLIASLGETG